MTRIDDIDKRIKNISEEFLRLSVSFNEVVSNIRLLNDEYQSIKRQYHPFVFWIIDIASRWKNWRKNG